MSGFCPWKCWLSEQSDRGLSVWGLAGAVGQGREARET